MSLRSVLHNPFHAEGREPFGVGGHGNPRGCPVGVAALTQTEEFVLD